MVKALCRWIAVLVATVTLPAQNLKEFEKKVTEFTLSNGLHFILVERHEAPVVSFHTYVNAGSINDPSGATGLAHMFEHMAFKGTETIGTKNWTAEKKALEAVEETYGRLEAERNKGPKADEARIHLIETQLKIAINQAQEYVQSNEYTRIIEQNGGVGLNAGTSLDHTEYFYSLPSNRTELWFLMESERFLHPVFREFYKERDVVQEENRMRVESSPQGKLLQTFLATAFAAFPYRNPPGGWSSDIANLRRAAATEFFDTYYVPGNINIAIVGDVNTADARRMAERYFGRLAAKPLPPAIHTEEPPQLGPKMAVVISASQPLAVIGYKRPDEYSPDDAVLDVLGMILSSGRTGLLYKELVEQKRLALAAETAPTYPDGRFPNLFLFFLVPNQGHTVAENQAALEDLLTRFEAKQVDEQTLQRVKTKLRASVVRRLDNNAGLASLLTSYYGTYGNWRKLFTTLDEYAHITAADVQRAAKQYLVSQNRTLCYTTAPAPPAAANPAGAPGGQQ